MSVLTDAASKARAGLGRFMTKLASVDVSKAVALPVAIGGAWSLVGLGMAGYEHSHVAAAGADVLAAYYDMARTAMPVGLKETVTSVFDGSLPVGGEFFRGMGLGMAGAALSATGVSLAKGFVFMRGLASQMGQALTRRAADLSRIKDAMGDAASQGVRNLVDSTRVAMVLARDAVDSGLEKASGVKEKLVQAESGKGAIDRIKGARDGVLVRAGGVLSKLGQLGDKVKSEALDRQDAAAFAEAQRVERVKAAKRVTEAAREADGRTEPTLGLAGASVGDSVGEVIIADDFLLTARAQAELDVQMREQPELVESAVASMPAFDDAEIAVLARLLLLSLPSVDLIQSISRETGQEQGAVEKVVESISRKLVERFVQADMDVERMRFGA